MNDLERDEKLHQYSMEIDAMMAESRKLLDEAWAAHYAMFWDWKTGCMPFHKKVERRVKDAINAIRWAIAGRIVRWLA